MQHRLRCNRFPRLLCELFTDDQIYSLLSSLNVQSVRKVVPNLSPCSDTISIARRGDTVRVPEVWNILRFELDLTGQETSIPNLAYQLTLFYHPRIRIATPSIVARYEYPYEDEELFWSENSFSKATIGPGDIDDTHAQGLYNVSYGPWSVNYGTNVFDAWDLARGYPEIKVGVVDDGAYVKSSSNSTYGHEDFTHQTYGNVFVDGKNYTPSTSKYYEITSHGTRVSGIIGAITNNEKGVAGIAGGSGLGDFVQMYALKAGDYDFNQNVVFTSLSWIAAAIFEAASKSQNGLAVDLINLSMQGMPSSATGIGSYDPLLHAAVAFAYRNDVPIFNSIGNRGIEVKQNEMMGCPASAYEDQIIVVGGYDGPSRFASSAYGAEVLDLLAPVTNSSTGLASSSVGGYSTFRGTSSAAPHVTGIAALMLEMVKEGAGQPNLPAYLAVEDYVQIMAEGRSIGPSKSTGLPLDKENESGYGFVNTKTSLELLSSPYELKHISVPYTAESGQPVTIDKVTITSSEHGYLQNGNPDFYGQVRQYEFTVTVSLGATYPDVLRVWVRGANTKGYSDLRHVLPDPQKPGFYHTLYSDCGWANVNKFGTNWAEVTTYLYQLYDNGNWVWLNGIEPDDIVFELSILAGPPISTGIDPVVSSRPGSFELYPSVVGTATGEITIMLHQNYSGLLTFCDILGRAVKSIEVTQGQDIVTISASDLAQNGVYFVRTVGAEATVRKLIVAR